MSMSTMEVKNVVTTTS